MPAATPARHKPPLLDRLLGAIAPIAALRRHTARQLLARAYEGASSRDGWRPRRPGASANADHFGDAATLRVRARALYQNTPYITRAIHADTANVIGTGIVPRSLDARGAKAAADLWLRWAAVADADARFDLAGLMAAAYRAMKIDGEVLIRIRPRRTEDGLPVPLQLQMLEVDWLDTLKSGTNNGNTIINGIEYDPLGKPFAYWLFDQHPGDTLGIASRITRSSPVPAARIIHLYRPDRPGQGRGITDLAPVIGRVRDLSAYEDAEMQRKNLEARLSVLASADVSSMANPNAPDTTSGSASTTKNDDITLGGLAGGAILSMPPGNNFTIIEPKPAPGYIDYVKHELHLIAAGLGVTYEMLTGDMREVNFSSARVALLEYRRAVEQLQWLVLVPRLCAPIWNAFIDAAQLAGALPQAFNRAVDWSTPKWDYVNPQQEIAADLAEISGGLCSVSEKLRRRGYQPDLVFDELAQDVQRLHKLGLLDVLSFWAKAKPASNTDASQGKPAS